MPEEKCKHDGLYEVAGFMLKCHTCGALFEPRNPTEIRAVVLYGADGGKRRTGEIPSHESEVNYNGK